MSRFDSESDTQVILRPEWSEWSERLSANRPLAGQAPPLTRSEHQQLRSTLVALALAEANRTRQLAQTLFSYDESPGSSRHDSTDWDSLPRRVAAYHPDRTPLVMTGHQPIVFHPGIERKYHAVGRFASQEQALAISIRMDQDPGDPGSFLVPHAIAPVHAQQVIPELGYERSTLAEVGSTLGEGRVQRSDTLQALARDVAERLCGVHCEAAALRADAVLQRYALLAGSPAMQAHSAVQSSLGRLHVPLEINFSQLMAIPLAQQVLAFFLLDGLQLSNAYNSQLDAWRKERAIRSAANPFPNLNVSDSRHELPFWLISPDRPGRQVVQWHVAAERVELYADDRPFLGWERNELPTVVQLSRRLASAGTLLPRGAMISLFFRLYCCDFFVHGTGGGSYDQFTDRFIANYFGLTPPAFAVASGTRYLFPAWRQILLELDDLALHAREARHHPQRYFGRGWFDSKDEEDLRRWIDEKSKWARELGEARRHGQSGAEAGQHLERLAEQIKSRVDAALAMRLTCRGWLTETTRRTLEERTWPWFYWGPDDASEDGGD